MLWLLNLGFAGGGSEITPEVPPPGGGGRYIRHYTPSDPPKRKFTKKDEKELVTLLKRATENDSQRAHKELEKKAKQLKHVRDAVPGVQAAVDKLAADIQARVKEEEITKRHAAELLIEIEEEEMIILKILECMH